MGLLDDPNAPPQTASLPPGAGPSPDDMGSEAGGLLAQPPASAGPTGRPEYFPFDPAKMTGTDYFKQILPHAAAAALPAGWTAEPTEHGGYRPGAVVEGTGGESMHASAGALDFRILRADGTKVPNEAGIEDTTGHYGNVAAAMRGMMDPDIARWSRWGNFFNSPYRDIMHVDFAGEGPNGPFARYAAGRTGQQVAAAPTVPNVTGRPP